jgi:hypothetical protein
VNLLIWIENTSLAEYMRVSAYGYAAMITLHSLGLAIMVGLSVVLSLRALDFFRSIPYGALRNLLKVAWIGFVVNILSGGSIFAMQATTYIADLEFLLKMFFVLLGAIFVALLQGIVDRAVATGSDGVVLGDVPGDVLGDVRGDARKLYAIAAIVSWTGAMIAGRLIAYL